MGQWFRGFFPVWENAKTSFFHSKMTISRKQHCFMAFSRECCRPHGKVLGAVTVIPEFHMPLKYRLNMQYCRKLEVVNMIWHLKPGSKWTAAAIFDAAWRNGL
jgi:hypothetical protein